MKKLFALILAMVMVLSMTACGGSGSKEETQTPAQQSTEAPKADPLKIDIASLYTENTVCDDACIKFAELLNESGLFEVNYFNNSQLGSLYDQIESLLSGAPIIALGGGSDWGDRVNVPLMGVVMTPFLYDELTDVYGVTTADYWKDMLTQAEASGVKILNFPIVSGSRYFMGNKKIMTSADYAGLKIRVPNSSAYINAFTAFGATPTPMPVGELYTALSQKLVDGLEFPYANAYSSQYYEVVKYASDAPYVTTFDFFGISLELWNSMNAEQQQTIESALAEVCDISFASFAESEAKGKAALQENGMEFYTPDIDSFRECMPTYYELCGWTDEFKAQVEDGMAAYRASK